MMRRLILTTLLAAACAGGDDATGLADERFIETIVALRIAAVQSPGSFAAQKQQILADNGVTEESLRAYIQAHADDPAHLASVWDRINLRLSESGDPVDE